MLKNTPTNAAQKVIDDLSKTIKKETVKDKRKREKDTKQLLQDQTEFLASVGVLKATASTKETAALETKYELVADIPNRKDVHFLGQITIPFTKEIASDILALSNVKGDRMVEDIRIKRLIASIRIVLRKFEIVVVYVKELDLWIRVNGQHSASLRKHHSYIFSKTPDAAIDFYVVETLADALDLFCVYDWRGSTRTPNHIYKMHIQNHIPLAQLGLPDYVYTTAMNAMTYEKYGKGWDGIPTVLRVKQFMADSVAFTEWLGTRIFAGFTKHENRKLAATPVATEIYSSWVEYHNNPKTLSTLEDYWLKARSGLSQNPTEAVHCVHRFLENTATKQCALLKELWEVSNYEQRRYLMRVGLVAHFTGQKYKDYDTFVDCCPTRCNNPEEIHNLPQYP